MNRYSPVLITSRHLTQADSATVPYTMMTGVVQTYDPAGGGLRLAFPTNVFGSDTVEIKNATNTSTPVEINPAPGHNVELPGTSDTSVLVSIPFNLTKPLAGYRWVFDGTDTWFIDYSYSIDEPLSKATQVDATRSPYTLQHNNEIVLADSTIGPITIDVPDKLPNDAKFTVAKTSQDRNLITIGVPGAERIENVRVPSDTLSSQVSLIAHGESFSYVKQGLNWYAYSHSLSDYPEVWYFEGPLDLTPGASLIPIVVDEETTEQSLLFTNAGGLLTSVFDVTVSIQTQVVFTHTLVGNNSDVWGRVTLQTSSTDPANILVPIDAAFAHSRSGDFGDTRGANSLVRFQSGQTIGVYGEEVESNSGTTDIEGLLVVFTVRS